MSDPVRLARPDLGGEELAAVAEVLASGRLTLGPQVAAFEAAVARAVGTAEAVAVSSGTAALARRARPRDRGGGRGDRPGVHVPRDRRRRRADRGARGAGRRRPGDLQRAARARCRRGHAAHPAVLAVHLFGRPVDWEELQTAVPQEVALVEDAAGALGARYRDTPWVRSGCSRASFNPRKIVTTGEGGAVTTDEAELAAAVRRLPRPRSTAAAGSTSPHQGSTTPAGRPLRARPPAAGAARGPLQPATRCGLVRRAARAPRRHARRGGGSPPRVAGLRHAPRRRDEALAGLRAEGIEAQIRLRGEPAVRVRGPRLVPGGRRGVRAGARPGFASTLTEAEVDRVAAALGASPEATVGGDPRLERPIRATVRTPRSWRATSGRSSSRRWRGTGAPSGSVPGTTCRTSRPPVSTATCASSCATSSASSRSSSSSAASPDRPFVAGPATWSRSTAATRAARASSSSTSRRRTRSTSGSCRRTSTTTCCSPSTPPSTIAVQRRALVSSASA